MLDECCEWWKMEDDGGWKGRGYITLAFIPRVERPLGHGGTSSCPG